ncbi:LysR family transcriptional regulator [Xylocopilactobacillus apicola]|uniref:LysR family transcriptional regulator n=1 Tax=Xylocopilactobacillus apicola TaxID=2932184 RepID=A0AAU9DRN9_9LACO|nr:LysR family transcriptional regulator [Xylocopilactobacillus apicola]BDR57848.1 LysR family transcriptional regulator [Xylocopilactobacillus apicola]
MNINHLNYFVEIAKNHSFSQTAANNNISQTAVSQQIANLERELNTKLFDRSILPIQLTPAGKIVYERALIILNQVQMIKSDLQNIEQPKVIRLAYPEGFGEPLEKFVLPFVQKNEPPECVLVKTDLDEIQNSLLQHLVDVAICFDSEITATTEIETLTIMHGNFELIVGPEHELYQKQEIRLADLARQNIIGITSKTNSNTTKLMFEHAKQDGFPLQISTTVKDTETALILVKLNQGVTFMPDYYPLTNEFSKLHRLKIINTHHQFNICLAWKKQNLAARSFVEDITKS